MTTPSDPPHTQAAKTSAGSSAHDAAPTGGNPRIIKRYSNRKLYDTVESRYVTLPQIAELVRRGEDVRIIDNNSKEDLTSVTLAQILYEEERKQSRALPLAALKDLIHTSGEKLFTSLREGPMGKLIGTKPNEQGGDAKAADAGAPGPAATAVSPHDPGGAGANKDAATGRLYEIYEQSRGSLQEWQHRVDDRVRKVLESLSPASQVEKLQAEVRKLAQRLEELESRLAARAGRKMPDDEK